MTHSAKVETKHWTRVRAALQHEIDECVPVSMWKHYHLQDRAPARLARITVDLWRRFEFDLIKLTPSGLYGVQDWGVGMQFGLDDDTAPTVIASPIQTADDWLSLPPLDVQAGALGRELEMCDRVDALLDGAAPYMMTIFSPLTLAQKMAGDVVYEHMRQEPSKLHQGLRTIRDTVVAYTRACLAAGVPGFFLATQQASHDLLSPAEYREFGLAYDQDIAAAMAEASIRMLHVCGSNIMLREASAMDVNCLSWAAGDTNPTLAEARTFTSHCLAGGLSLDTLADGSATDARQMIQRHLAGERNRSLILAPDCVIKGPTPDANLAAVMETVRA